MSSDFEPPPDLRNWFSSYTYQSPALDTGDGFADSFVLREGDNERTELRVEDSEDEGEEIEKADSKKTENSGQLGIAEKFHVNGTGVLNYPDSLSPPSEPPDVWNWFSSYVYESPTLNSDAIGFSLHSYACNDNIEEADKREEENVSELNCEKAQDGPGSSNYRATTAVVGSFSQPKNVNLPARRDCCGSARSKDSPFKDYLCSQMNSGLSVPATRSRLVKELKDLHHESEIESAVNPRKVVDIPKQLEGYKIQAREGQPTAIKDPASCSNLKIPVMRLTSLDSGTQCSGECGVPNVNGDISNLGWILPISKSREGKRGAKSKGDKGYIFRENDFCPTSKKENLRITNENCMEKVSQSRSNHNACESLGAAAGKHTEARRALKDMTNIYSSDEVEIAGKWRCPQKGKPYDGPPLKQLRLEQLFRQV